MSRELDIAAVERGGQLGVKWGRAARRIRAVEHRDAGALVERGCDGRRRERSKRHKLQQPGGLVLVAKLVDDVLDRSGGGAERDERARRVLQPVRLERAVPPACQQLEVEGNRFEDVEGGLERGRLLAAQLEVVVGHRERPLRRRARPCRARCS